MKDENDKFTLELVKSTPDVAGRRAAQPTPPARPLGKPKRLPHQSCSTPPGGAKSAEPFFPLGFARSVLPVSAVARHWGISARRVRVMLAEGRLAGRMLENGYWEVFYPYCYIEGTRGPTLQRYRKLPEYMKEHF